jgi:hypothetical protein
MAARKAARKKPVSPTLQLRITDELRETAIASNSGGCLIADAIKQQYPHLSGVTVDMATVRATDRAAGFRYIYLTPQPAMHVLLSFDQGWPNPVDEVTIKRAVQILPITRATTQSSPAAAAKRETRRAELQARVDAGEDLSPREKAVLTQISKPKKSSPERPASRGPAEVHVQNGGENHGVTIVGGNPLVQGPPHPNLLRGRNRHFGAKLADPGQAFKEAVDQAVAEKLAEKD